MSKRKTFYLSFIDDEADPTYGPHLKSKVRWQLIKVSKPTNPRLRVIPMQIDLSSQTLHVIVFTPLGTLDTAETERIKAEIIRVYGRFFPTN